MTDKVQMHVELNEAYSVLTRLAHVLNLQSFNSKLLNDRAFLSRMIDASAAEKEQK